MEPEIIKSVLDSFIKSEMTLTQGNPTAPASQLGASVTREELIHEIILETKSPQSRRFYEKAISLLGEGLVKTELLELRWSIKNKDVQSPGRYFTQMLKERIKAYGKAEVASTKFKDGSKERTHFSRDQMTLFSEFTPLKVASGQEQMLIENLFSKDTVPWVTYISPDFFTLSTNKAKWDEVTAKFRTLDGQVSFVPIVRGKYFPDDTDAYGILTPEHGRILGALEVIWVEQGQPVSRAEDGTVHCWCNVQVRRLAKLLGWDIKGFGGKQLSHLKRKVIELRNKPYYLRWDGVEIFRRVGRKGESFTFLADAPLVDKKDGGRPETVFRVMFSPVFSRLLMLRRTVSRPKQMLTHGGELAWMVRMYLEPILLGSHGDNYSGIELLHLIEELHLPPAKWHGISWERKKIFQRVVMELNGMLVSDGRSFLIEISKGLNDHVLDARLIKRTGILEASQVENRSPKGV